MLRCIFAGYLFQIPDDVHVVGRLFEYCVAAAAFFALVCHIRAKIFGGLGSGDHVSSPQPSPSSRSPDVHGPIYWLMVTVVTFAMLGYFCYGLIRGIRILSE